MALPVPRTWAANEQLLDTTMNSGVRDPILAVMPISAVKGAGQDSTTTTLVDDLALFVPVVAGAVYEMRALIRYLAPTTGDLKIGWSAPALSTLDWTIGGPPSTASAVADTTYWGAQSLAGTDTVGGTGQSTICRPVGTLQVGGTSGLLRFRWSQGNASGTTTVQAGSNLILIRLS